jgi:hypothetical protein
VKRALDWAAQRRRPITLISCAVVLLGAVLLGFGVGQLVFPRTVVASGEPAGVGTAAPSASEAPAPVMPDLLGLDEASARRVLTDAGLSPEVSIGAEVAAGPAGLVVAQEPAAGSSGAASAVRLVLSTASTVPAVVGLPAHDARTSLEALGAVVTVSRVVQPGSEDGVVLSVSPEAGAPLDRVVELTVADAGVALALADLDQVDGSGCSVIASGTVNGAEFSDSVGCRVRSAETFAEWNLGRHGSVFEATLGMTDSGRTGSTRVQIYGDGTLLTDQQVDFGASTALAIDVRGVLRLSVRVAGSGTSAEGPTVVLGNGIVRATPDEVALIRAGS